MPGVQCSDRDALIAPPWSWIVKNHGAFRWGGFETPTERRSSAVGSDRSLISQRFIILTSVLHVSLAILAARAGHRVQSVARLLGLVAGRSLTPSDGRYARRLSDCSVDYDSCPL